MEKRSLFGLSEHLERISKNGDPLEILGATVDFEHFRDWLVEGVGYGDGAKGGRPPCRVSAGRGVPARLK